MNIRQLARQQLHVHRDFAVRFLSFLVTAHGVFILATTLLAQLAAHRGTHLTGVLVDLPLLIGLSLLYLGGLLRRRKRTAWLVTTMAYTFYLGTNVTELLEHARFNESDHYEFIGALLVPFVVLSLLVIFQKEFVVKSDTQSFRFAARFSAIAISVAAIYGVLGFILLDRSDFHQEIGPLSAAHYTIDQFNVTTTHPARPYTKRAHLFLDSLSFVSSGALLYAGLSLFQPLRTRLSAHRVDRRRVTALLEKYGGASEEYFKLWPRDKQFFFDDSGQSVLAFRAQGGVALCLGDPIGEPATYVSLLSGFKDQCFGNDWVPSFVYVNQRYRALYEDQGLTLQKLGEEAIVDIDSFRSNIAGAKYFRQITNKFTKLEYSHELLCPPHSQDLLNKLRGISNDWLAEAGRTERGFVMGYYSDEYMSQCRIMVVRDSTGVIQAFLNIVPATFDHDEATYDLLRYAPGSPGNINDYLLLGLIEQLAVDEYRYLNFGLCPLVGLDTTDEKNSLINSVLSFAYANGDRFYSFNGLRRFKAKYHPEWHDRYIAYQGGTRGFGRATAAVMRAMRVR